MDDKYSRSESDDFIEVYDDIFPEEFCDKLIEVIEKHEKVGLTQTRRKTEGRTDSTKSDTFMFLRQKPEQSKEWLEENYGAEFETFIEENQLSHWTPPYDEKFNKIFWGEVYPRYLSKYSILNDLDRHGNDVIKLQKTRPTEGYHIWHCENGDINTSTRVLVWMLYLNDEFEAGETEFLYQSRRVKPKKGRIVVWPSGFTHTHRGNPPIGGTKYAATGWIMFTNDK